MCITIWIYIGEKQWRHAYTQLRRNHYLPAKNVLANWDYYWQPAPRLTLLSLCHISHTSTHPFGANSKNMQIWDCEGGDETPVLEIINWCHVLDQPHDHPVWVSQSVAEQNSGKPVVDLWYDHCSYRRCYVGGRRLEILITMALYLLKTELWKY